MSRTHHVSRARARPKKIPGQMNLTERRFEANYLKPLLASGEILSYKYEAMKFRYGKDFKATYTPDFIVVRKDEIIECIDVKGSGGWEEHTRVKMKACAEEYWMFEWAGFTEQKGRNGKGVFERELFSHY